MISEQLFKDTMKLFPSGITVITWQADTAVQGITVSAFSSLSLNPPLVLFCIDRNAYIHPAISRKKDLIVNILAEGQKKLAYQFAGADRENLEQHLVYNNELKEPMIADAQANLRVQIMNVIPQGDHDIFIAQIEEVFLNHDKKPLLYHNSRIFS